MLSQIPVRFSHDTLARGQVRGPVSPYQPDNDGCGEQQADYVPSRFHSAVGGGAQTRRGVYCPV